MSDTSPMTEALKLPNWSRKHLSKRRNVVIGHLMTQGKIVQQDERKGDRYRIGHGGITDAR